MKKNKKIDWYKKALALHYKWNGKFDMTPKMHIKDRADLSCAYTPGVAEPCRVINKDVKKAYDLTGKSNLVAVITDGTAVLGLGDIGPQTGMPVMEGKAVLFKEFGGVNAIALCINTKDPKKLIDTIYHISDSFGGINLEDISSPRCIEVETELRKKCSIPVFHDDQWGTAIVVCAAIINACKVAHKDLHKIRVVINGAGSAGMAVAKMLRILKVGDIILVDRIGIVDPSKPKQFNKYQIELAKLTNKKHVKGTLKDALKHSDVFVGVSAPRILNPEWIKLMNKKACIFAMANPEPEIMPDLAKKAGAFIVGTGRSDFPNQINNVLAFPGIFRGALDARAKDITNAMKMAACYAIADAVPSNKLSKDNIMPLALDKSVAKKVAKAVFNAWKKYGIKGNK